MKHVADLFSGVLSLIFRFITAPLLLVLFALLLISTSYRWLRALFSVLSSLHIKLPKSPMALNWKKALVFHRSRTV